MENTSSHKIVVIGTGYVGLVSGVCFAEIGHEVVCIDNDDSKISMLRKGQVPIYEPGLDQLVKQNHDSGRLSFSTKLADHINNADEVVIAVGTPTNSSDGSTDLSYVYSVVEEIIKTLKKDIVVIMKSTVPPGTCASVQKKFDDSGIKYKCRVASNPEFLREGDAIEDFMSPDRVIVGCDAAIKEQMESLYADHIKRGIKFISTNLVTAELIKYSANTFLAAKVAFINEISSISENINADMNALKDGIGSDSRIGYKFLNPGPGFGGSCFPKDISALINFSDNIRSNNALIKSVIGSNKNRIGEIANNVTELAGKDKILGFLGLTYKANTDDVRTSPAIDVINILLGKGYKIKSYDPMGMESAKKILGDKIDYCSDPYEVAKNASALVVITEWDEFKSLDPKQLAKTMHSSRLYDVRGIIDTNSFRKAGFVVKKVGSNDA